MYRSVLRSRARLRILASLPSQHLLRILRRPSRPKERARETRRSATQRNQAFVCPEKAEPLCGLEGEGQGLRHLRPEAQSVAPCRRPPTPHDSLQARNALASLRFGGSGFCTSIAIPTCRWTGADRGDLPSCLWHLRKNGACRSNGASLPRDGAA